MKKIVSIAVVLVMLFSLFAGTQAVVANESTSDAAPVYYDKLISDSMVGKGKESSFASGLLYSFTSNDYYAFSNNDGSVSITRTSEATESRASAYFSFGNRYVLNHGRFIFKTRLTVSDPSHSITIAADNMSEQNFDSTSLIKDGKFLATDNVCESDAAYELEIIYDLDKNTKTYKVNGRILVDEASTDKPIGQIRSFSVRWSAGAAEQGAKITFDDLKLFHTTRVPFEILSPVSGAVIENQKTVLLSASVPGDYTDVQFYLDGQSVTPELADGVYSVSVPWENISLGIHKFKCTAKNGTDIETIETHFETAGSAGTVWLNKEDIVKTASSSDTKPLYASETDLTKFAKTTDRFGNQDAALMIPSDATLNVNYQTWFMGNTICFDGWVKRDEGTAVYFYLKDSNRALALSASETDKKFINEDGSFLNIYVNDNDNKIHKKTYTATKMPANEWHHIRWTIDTNSYICNIYYDGNLIQSSIHSVIKSYKLKPYHVYTKAANKAMYFDEAKISMIEPRITAVSYRDSSDAPIIDDGYVIPVNAEKIVLDMTNPVMNNYYPDADWTKDIVSINGESVLDVTSDGTKLIITPGKSLSEYENAQIQLGTPYYVYSSNETKNNCYNAAFKPISVYLTIDSEDNIGEFSYSSSGEGVVASIDIAKSHYDTTLPDKCVIIVASYSADNELMACEFAEKTLSQGVNSLTFTLSNTNGGTKHKAFLWNSFGSLTPLK